MRRIYELECKKWVTHNQYMDVDDITKSYHAVIEEKAEESDTKDPLTFVIVVLLLQYRTENRLDECVFNLNSGLFHGFKQQ